MSDPALVVDRKGLARKLAHRPKAFLLYELLQNAWDEDVRVVRATVEPVPFKAECLIVVEDDSPEGFADLASVYTLFKDSKKAPDPTKRGRFEMGEKLVIAAAIRATLTTTKGTVYFEGDTRRETREKTKKGSRFEGLFRLTRQEVDELLAAARLLAPPMDVRTYLNGVELMRREPVGSFQATLATIRADEDGQLSPTQRRTVVRLYEVLPGETAHVYEMGIPVLATGDQWHYDVQQRVPVNWERDNVPPAFLRALRVHALNAMYERLDAEQATASWVAEASEDTRCQPEAIGAVVEARFGEKVVTNDPSDPEGTKIAISKGYTVIPGGAFSKAAWANVRASGAALPAGQVTPSPKPYDPDGRPENVIPESEWTLDMRRMADFSSLLFSRLCQKRCHVVIVREPRASWDANFGAEGSGHRLCLNYGSLGKRWFARPKRDPEVLDLLLHEFCHLDVQDHLSAEMHEAATRLG